MTEIPEIFISHMADDEAYRHYFLEICNIANTKPIFEELEQLVKYKIFWWQILEDIDRAKAVFVILSQNIQKEEQKHTRDWIVWETGVAAAKKKDVWVLEPYREFGKISIVIPYFTHYMQFEISDDYRRYIKNIIESYSNLSISRPPGIRTSPNPTCPNCFWTYEVHIPYNTNKFRCPNCNKLLEFSNLNQNFTLPS
jgi:hypothetical protein